MKLVIHNPGNQVIDQRLYITVVEDKTPPEVRTNKDMRVKEGIGCVQKSK